MFSSAEDARSILSLMNRAIGWNLDGNLYLPMPTSINPMRCPLCSRSRLQMAAYLASPWFYHDNHRLHPDHEGKKCRRCGSELENEKDRELGLCHHCRELLHGSP